MTEFEIAQIALQMWKELLAVEAELLAKDIIREGYSYQICLEEVKKAYGLGDSSLVVDIKCDDSAETVRKKIISAMDKRADAKNIVVYPEDMLKKEYQRGWDAAEKHYGINKQTMPRDQYPPEEHTPQLTKGGILDEIARGEYSRGFFEGNIRGREVGHKKGFEEGKRSNPQAVVYHPSACLCWHATLQKCPVHSFMEQGRRIGAI